MNIKYKVENFCSYKVLEFTFTDAGLCLIEGSTGSGKSTLCDIPPWVLFGKTAKNGNVDEVISWGKNYTKGEAQVNINGEDVVITRIRGKENDLSLSVNGEIIRGKDISDTQRLINTKLGLSLDTYILGSYYHELSPVSQLFTATAKQRRQIMEQLTDLSLAKTLNDNITKYKKEVNKDLEILSKELSILKNDLTHHKQAHKDTITREAQWITRKEVTISDLKRRMDTFHEEQENNINDAISIYTRTVAQLQSDKLNLQKRILSDETIKSKTDELALRKTLLKDTVCPQCGSPKDTDKRLLLLRDENKFSNDLTLSKSAVDEISRIDSRLSKLDKDLEIQINKEKTRDNPYLLQLKSKENEESPYDLPGISKKINEVSKQISEKTKEYTSSSEYLHDLELLLHASQELRGTLVSNVIVDLEHKVNTYLADNFDSEFKVKLEVEDADSVEAKIYREDNICSYTQLSKGQRQILKLCVGISVMDIINDNNATTLSTIFLDECLDGMSEDFKLKVYNLLLTLEQRYKSIFVVEHSSEFKSYFDKQFKVKLVDNKSVVEET